VDDGIVIAENIYQHWEDGKTPVQAALDGTLEVLPAVFSAILTTAIAFSIFFVVDGIMGDFFVEMGFVVIATLIFSLVEGAFILPAHVAHSKALSEENRKENIKDAPKGFMIKIIDKFTSALNFIRDKWYGPSLNFGITNPWLIIVSTIGFFAITLTLVTTGIQKTSFFPPIYGDNFKVQLDMAPGTNEEITKKWISEVEEKVWHINDSLKETSGKDVVTAIQKSLGPAVHEASIRVLLSRSEDREFTSAQISTLALSKVGNIPNVEKLTAKDGGPFGRAISIALYSKDDKSLELVKNNLLDGMRKMGTLKNIEASDQQGMLELDIKLNAKAQSLGLSYTEVLTEIRKGFYGYEVQRLQRGLDEVKVWVRYQKKSRSSIGDLENSQLKIKGKVFLLKDLVDITQARGVTQIDHLDGKKMIKVQADLLDVENSSSSSLLGFVNDSLVAPELALHPEVKKSVEGQAREMGKVMRSIKSRGWMILLFMIVVVVLTFRSFTQAFAVFITSIFGFAGVVWGHMFHGFQMSIFSMFGMIALIGIMINDALVLISALNVNLKRKMDYIPALKKAALSRFRPILLTSITTIAGLAPLIFEKSMQAQFLIPMAIAIAYGLLMATFLTLVFLPSILLLFNKFNKIYFWLKTGTVAKRDADTEAAVRELEAEQLVNKELN
jgi:multidrug efflux pump subunit AcrB